MSAVFYQKKHVLPLPSELPEGSIIDGLSLIDTEVVPMHYMRDVCEAFAVEIPN